MRDTPAYRQRVMQPMVTGSREQMVPAFRKVFGSPEGQLVLDYICEELCGVDKPLFFGLDNGLVYNVARRDVGLDIFRMAMGMVADKPEVKT